MLGDNIQVMVAEECHEAYVDTILKTIEDAAKVRGTGIAKHCIGRRPFCRFQLY